MPTIEMVKDGTLLATSRLETYPKDDELHGLVGTGYHS